MIGLNNFSYNRSYIRSCSTAKKAVGKFDSEIEKKAADSSMTLNEYKKYIFDKICSITKNNGYSSITQISDEGYAAMKSDPGYEEWVLGKIKEDVVRYASSRSGGGDYFSVLSFGESRSEYRCEGFRLPGPAERRRRKQAQEDMLREMRIEKRRKDKLLLKKNRENTRFLEQTALKRALLEMEHIGNGSTDNFVSLPTELANVRKQLFIKIK